MENSKKLLDYRCFLESDTESSIPAIQYNQYRNAASGGKALQGKEISICQQFVQSVQAELIKAQSPKERIQAEMAAKR